MWTKIINLMHEIKTISLNKILITLVLMVLFPILVLNPTIVFMYLLKSTIVPPIYYYLLSTLFIVILPFIFVLILIIIPAKYYNLLKIITLISTFISASGCIVIVNIYSIQMKVYKISRIFNFFGNPIFKVAASVGTISDDVMFFNLLILIFIFLFHSIFFLFIELNNDKDKMYFKRFLIIFLLFESFCTFYVCVENFRIIYLV